MQGVGSGRLNSGILLFLIGVAVANITSLFAQTTGKLPSAAEVLDRYVEPARSRDALLRRKSMTVHERCRVLTSKLDFETAFCTKVEKMLAFPYR
jgi:hypothetical protein